MFIPVIIFRYLRELRGLTGAEGAEMGLVSSALKGARLLCAAKLVQLSWEVEMARKRRQRQGETAGAVDSKVDSEEAGKEGPTRGTASTMQVAGTVRLTHFNLN